MQLLYLKRHHEPQVVYSPAHPGSFLVTRVCEDSPFLPITCDSSYLWQRSLLRLMHQGAVAHQREVAATPAKNIDEFRASGCLPPSQARVLQRSSPGGSTPAAGQQGSRVHADVGQGLVFHRRSFSLPCYTPHAHMHTVVHSLAQCVCLTVCVCHTVVYSCLSCCSTLVMHAVVIVVATMNPFLKSIASTHVYT